MTEILPPKNCGQFAVNGRKAIRGCSTKPKQALIEKGELRPTTKPDIDNYVKGVRDGLNKVIWQDDSQVVNLTVRKFYSMHPRVVVRVAY
ncbi:RusA family crossover junction endodeoxyribonuclease [Psychrobacillus psychrotolerans]|uniref:RusA family crossover junction endodeoxyribonuclease n=1 Tax=Psychrobacillus psychrotolerans TaxID=126156 RepID=UPI003B010930